MKDHGQDIRSQEAVKRANALLASQAVPDTATTIYSAEFVRSKFADYETQILNLREELAARRGSQAVPVTQDAQQASEPDAYLVTGRDGHNETYRSTWIKQSNAEACAAGLYQAKITLLYAAPTPDAAKGE